MRISCQVRAGTSKVALDLFEMRDTRGKRFAYGNVTRRGLGRRERVAGLFVAGLVGRRHCDGIWTALAMVICAVDETADVCPCAIVPVAAERSPPPRTP